MEKVYFLDTVHPILEKRLSKAGFLCVNQVEQSLDEIKKTMSDATGIVLRSKHTLNENLLKQSPNLKFIARSGSGLENIDLAYCKKHQIEVYNSPEGNKDAVAQHCLGFLLSLLNNFKQADQDLKKGKWLRERNRGLEIENQYIGIIGYGNNGQAFAKILAALGAKVLVYDKYKSGFSSDQITECRLEEIFKRATVISFHIPLTDETAYLADYQFFKSFSAPVLLLNISRGKIVKTRDLIRALDEGVLLGAGLDVLEEEGKSFSLHGNIDRVNELNNRSNVIITPHVAGWTSESYFKLSNILAEKILNSKSPQRGL